MKINVQVGLELSAIWMCEKYIRAHSEHLGVQNGINVLKGLESVKMKCRT